MCLCVCVSVCLCNPGFPHVFMDKIWKLFHALQHILNTFDYKLISGCKSVKQQSEHMPTYLCCRIVYQGG